MKKRFSDEQIIHILRECEKPGKREEVCRAHGIADQTYYRWKRKYQGTNVEKLKRLKQLERENARLRKLVADQALAHQIIQEEFQKKGWI
jgi:putative transposase